MRALGMDDTVKSCKPSRTRAFTLIELMVVIAIIGILAAILLPTLSMALKHAKRIKCVSNMRQIGAAFHGFSVDNSQRLPWQLTAGGRKTQYGNHYSWEPNVVFCSTSMRSELSNPALLVSPCDPDRKSSNEKAIAMWGKVSPRNPIPREAVSYNLCEGADVSRPTTVLALTRNLSTDNIAMARWVGAEEATPQSMGLLGSNKGQILLTDGSVPLSKDSDLKSSGNVVGQHLTATGGITVGQSSARVMGWSNNPKVILAQHFFHLPSQYFDSWIRHRADPSQKMRYQRVIDNLTTIYVKFYGLNQQLAISRAWGRLHSKYTRRYYFEYIIAGRLPINDVLGLETLPERNDAGEGGFGIGQ